MQLRIACLCLALAAWMTASASENVLKDYATRPDGAYEWKQTGQTTLGDLTIIDLELTSQVWRGITWTHLLQVFMPKNPTHPDTMLLFVVGGRTGSKASQGELLLGSVLATQTGSPCAMLHHVPNQPLFDGKREDDLIAHTFVEFMKSGEADWPLLLPMVKSAVRAMDALQEFSDQNGARRPEGFVITGASKRGWTSWLTAATDPRIKGTVPLVIDMLHLSKQMPHQMEAWGEYSEEIADYTERGLQQQLETESGRTLLDIVDPYSYRDVLTMPKLAVIGTNDPYWVLDALNLYWDDLKEPKCVLYVPNSGHDLDDRERAIAGIVGFHRHLAAGKPLPTLHWQHSDADGTLRLVVETDAPAVGGQLWLASSAKRDFREANWLAVPMTATSDRRFVGEVIPPRDRYVALYGELTFETEGHRMPLSTQVRIAPPQTPPSNE